jgi:hypothetical protein
MKQRKKWDKEWEMSLCDKNVRERLRTERPRLHTEFNVERLISCKEDANCITVVVEFGKLCPVVKKVELAGYLEGVLGKEVQVIALLSRDTERTGQ